MITGWIGYPDCLFVAKSINLNKSGKKYVFRELFVGTGKNIMNRFNENEEWMGIFGDDNCINIRCKGIFCKQRTNLLVSSLKQPRRRGIAQSCKDGTTWPESSCSYTILYRLRSANCRSVYATIIAAKCKNYRLTEPARIFAKGKCDLRAHIQNVITSYKDFKMF